MVQQPRYPPYPGFSKRPSTNQAENNDLFFYRDVMQEVETCTRGTLVMLKGGLLVVVPA